MPRTSVITREELYELVWSAPMIKVADKFDVSGSYLARVCTALRVPRPERGYWAKLAVGKAPKRPALPEPQPGDPIVCGLGPMSFPLHLCPSRDRHLDPAPHD